MNYQPFEDPEKSLLGENPQGEEKRKMPRHSTPSTKRKSSFVYAVLPSKDTADPYARMKTRDNIDEYD